MNRYKLEFEFDCEENLGLVTSSIKDYLELSKPNHCVLNCIIDPNSINVTTKEETVTLPKEEYEELVKYSNYVYHWGNRVVKCKRCGNLNPSHYICASCGYDGD